MKNGYIITNKEQELDVLKKIEQKGFKWGMGDLPTEFIFSEGLLFHGFPYIISTYGNDGYITWSYYSEDYKDNIVYDGRKENKMKRYLVTQEFMEVLNKWKEEFKNSDGVVSISDFTLERLPGLVDDWRFGGVDRRDKNERFGAIINWVNGEDVFQTQKTYKYYIARTSSPVMYLSMKKWYHSEFPKYDTISSEKKIFDTREEAEKWIIPGYEVVEIDENEL